MRHVDIRKREEEILDLIVESYIEESRPISSSYLRERFRLSYSSATIRNVMLSLENGGFLSHVHTSSGKVPTKIGFKHYVGHLSREDILKDEDYQQLIDIDTIDNCKELFEKALELLTEVSGYTSMIGTWGIQEGLFLRGIRFIFNQPEFEDITRLKNLFYTLEVKITQLQELLFSCVGQELKILIGDEIGFDEMSDCSLLISGLKEGEISCALAILGPMRMNYAKALESLQSVKHNLENSIRKLL